MFGEAPTRRMFGLSPTRRMFGPSPTSQWFVTRPDYVRGKRLKPLVRCTERKPKYRRSSLVIKPQGFPTPVFFPVKQESRVIKGMGVSQVG